MNLTNNHAKIKKIKESFLKMSEISIQDKTSELIPTHVIYRITNLINGKVYIGKTRNINNRAGEYIHRFISKFAIIDIERAIVNEGIENFVMEPIALCGSDEEAKKKEKEMIMRYDALNPDKGYNKCLVSAFSTSRKPRQGNKQSIEVKTKRAKFIAAVNVETKKMYLCAGGKLYGTFIGKSKDIVKNAIHTQTKLYGSYIIFLEKEPRDVLLQKIKDRYSNYKNKKKECLDKVEEYELICNDLDSLILDINRQEIIDKYNIEYIRYADNELGYEIVALEDFITSILL